jgi:SAM-dependent methyltransferase
MRKLNLGCGRQKLPGWENYDMEMDLREPLPVADESVRFIHAEHVVEHVTHHEAWCFFEECRRVLAPGGVVRICVPSVVKALAMMDDNRAQEYLDYDYKREWSDGSKEGALRAILFCHKHQALWSEDLLVGVLFAIGFITAYPCKVNESKHRDLRGIEHHGYIIGDYVNEFQSVVVEAIK